MVMEGLECQIGMAEWRYFTPAAPKTGKMAGAGMHRALRTFVLIFWLAPFQGTHIALAALLSRLQST
jgi:hypothetical protein